MKNKFKLKKETVWSCDLCGEYFLNKKEDGEHELTCKNKELVKKEKSGFLNKFKKIIIAVISYLSCSFGIWIFLFFIIFLIIVATIW